MEPLKHVYNDQFFKKLTRELKLLVPGFPEKKFLAAIHNSEWQHLELKQRIRHISTTLGAFLPGDYPAQVRLLCGVIASLKDAPVKQNSFPWLFIPDFIEVYGLDDLSTSLDAMETITAFISCEFAVRPFLLSSPREVMKRMLKWSKHADENVRRFSSEGCRPRLPWGKAIPAFKKDPAPILPILENLKNDPSEFVRKSVANNINDIAKDHPAVVLGLIRKWKGRSPYTDWILKHGSRTLLRKADANIYEEFGLSAVHDCEVSDFVLSRPSINLGEAIEFVFTLRNNAAEKQLFRIELGVYYVKSGGKTTRKLFKVTEKTFSPGTSYKFKRKIDFTDLTTRKHYPGTHAVSIVVNGTEVKKKAFKVTALTNRA